MDAFHPWTKYEIVRLRDEERLLRARDAMRVREFAKTVDHTLLKPSQRDGDATTASSGSWLDRLRRRQPVADGATVRARPV